jgi:carbonic anhydrase
MDTRLTSLLTAALGLDNGDANIIKVAGAWFTDPYGSVMRSLLVAIYELGVKEIMVIAHTECGFQHTNCTRMTELMKQGGIDDQVFEAVKEKGINLETWLEGFKDTESSVRNSIAIIRNHPLVPAHVEAYGYIFETDTGRLIEVK